MLNISVTRAPFNVGFQYRLRAGIKFAHTIGAVCLVLLFCAGPAIYGEQDAPVPEVYEIVGVKYAVVTECKSEQYNLSLTIAPAAGETKSLNFGLLFGFQDAKNYYRLSLEPSSAVLFCARNGAETEIGRLPGSIPDFANAQKLLIERRRSLLSVSLDSKVVIETIDSTFTKGGVAIAATKNARRLKSLKVQKCEEIHDGDDFMRTEDQIASGELGGWEKVSGEWRFYSVMEDVREIPDPFLQERIEERPERTPEAERSSNPFSFGGKSKEEEAAIVIRGYRFWDDYSLSASAKTKGADFGIVFYFQDKDNYFLLRWQAYSYRELPNLLQLVKVSTGKENCLAEAHLKSRINQWYNLSVTTLGQRIKAYVDGALTFDVITPEAVGGAVGLYAKGENETHFDDVAVATNKVYEFDCAHVLERNAEQLGAKWAYTRKSKAIGHETEKRSLVARGEGEGKILLGDAKWQDYVFSVSLKVNDASAQAIGVLAGYIDEKNHLIFRWGGKSGPCPNRIQLVQENKGAQTILADFPGAFKLNQWHRIQLDLTEQTVAKVYIDGVLELRATGVKIQPGRPGLYVLNCKNAIFNAPTVRFEKEEDMERPPNNEIFIEDPFMLHWSSSQGAWVPVQDTYREFWHKGDFFGRYSLTVPFENGTEVLFCNDPSDPKGRKLEPERGYTLQIGTPGARARYRRASVVRLTRLGKVIKEWNVKPTPKPIKEATINRDGKYIWIQIPYVAESRPPGDAGEQISKPKDSLKEIITYRDDDPPKGTKVALSMPRTMQASDFERVKVVRYQVKDEYFEKAPADWRRIGNWEIINRFTCDPRWSHMTGIDKGPAILWSKAGYSGDFTVEYYAGMKMQPSKVWRGPYFYPRVGDINVTVCGDGENLDSGYTVTLAAWDPTWSETWTYLYRQREIVAKSDRELVPRNRELNPPDRIIPVPWINAKRPIHGAWYYIKLRKIGNRIEYYFDNEFIFAYDDANPLKGHHIAIWTQDDAITIARVKVSYQKKEIPAQLNAEKSEIRNPKSEVREDLSHKSLEEFVSINQSPSIAILSSTHPGVCFGFEGNVDGWSNVGGEHGAFLEVDKTTHTSGASSLKVININPGGSFGAKIPIGPDQLVPPIDLTRASELCFDYKIPKDVKVNLYLRLKDHYPLHFIEITGESRSDENVKSLGKITAPEAIQTDDKWHHATFDIAAALKTLYPFESRLLLEELKIGNFHEGYLNAGFGGNGANLSYNLDDFRIVATGGDVAELSWKPLDLGRRRALQSPNFHATGTSGLLSYSHALDRNPNTEPDKTIEGSQTNVHLTSLDSGLWFFHLKAKDAKGGWTATVHYPFEVKTKSISISEIEPPDGAEWGGTPLKLHLQTKESAEIDLAKTEIAVNGIALPANHKTLSYDAQNKTLTINVVKAHLPATFADGAKVKFSAQLISFNGAISKSSWNYVMKHSLDKTPPSFVSVSVITNDGKSFPSYLINDTFEDDLGAWRGIDYDEDLENDGAIAVRDPSTGAAGSKWSLKVFNKLVGGSAAVLAWDKPFNAGKYPLLAFDYKIRKGFHTDLIINPSETPKCIVFNDTDDVLPKFADQGYIPNVINDNKWRHAEINWQRRLRLQEYHPKNYQISQIIFADGLPYQSNGPTTTFNIDNFRVSPTISGKNGVKLTWKTTDLSGVKGYSSAWNANPEFDPPKQNAAVETSKAFTNIPEGETYFHIRAADNAGNWSETSHHRFLIDNTPPQFGRPIPLPDRPSASTLIRVRIRDDNSGTDPSSLTLTINGHDYPLGVPGSEFNPSTSFFKWDWNAGHIASETSVPDGKLMECSMTASDFAGNSVEPLKWQWRMDYSRDRRPPLPPVVECLSHDVLVFDTFSDPNDMGEWATRDEDEGASLRRFVREPITNDYCIELTPLRPRGTFDAYIRKTPYDAAKYPIISFDYSISRKVMVDIAAEVGGKWYEVNLTAPTPGYTVIGSVSVVANEMWYKTYFNLYEMLKKAIPDRKDYKVTSLVIGDFGENRNPKKAVYYIDNFAILGYGDPVPDFEWSSFDITGIRGYSFEINHRPNSVPDMTSEGTQTKAKLDGLDGGMYYFHCRAQDNGGNWGSAFHYPYYVKAKKSREGGKVGK